MVVQDTGTVGVTASRVLFEHSSDGVLFFTPNGRITAVNPAACALLDMSADEICRRGCEGLVDQEDPRWKIAVAERDRTGSSMGVARLRRGDGRYIDIETTARLFHDDDGSVMVFTILRDITSRTAIEREIEELSARLLELSRGDDLTGFQNRRGLIVSGTHLLQFADREDTDVQIMCVDVGNVQELNERVGRHAGDAALQAVARALTVAFRRNDVLARIGGTQFLVLALDLPAPDCLAITSRVRWHLAAPETTEFVGAAVEVSFGWTTRRAGDRSSLEDLMARSDWAMLEARDAARAANGALASAAR